MLVKSQQYTPPLFSGYVSPNINADKSNFKISIGESANYVTSNPNGYFELSDDMVNTNLPCALKIYKDGFL
ncbi:MAG: hypothetical protein Q8942_08530, partial [Bacillota bacterium]|nr:hypothetical protein [Bacillota bacterium]